MRVSIQRGCDGVHPDIEISAKTCLARLELEMHIPGGAPAPAWDKAFEAAAVALGWRRIGGKGIAQEVYSTTNARCMVPDTKTWIVCPDHAKGTECSRCGASECSCLGGPRFDVRIGDGDET